MHGQRGSPALAFIKEMGRDRSTQRYSGGDGSEALASKDALSTDGELLYHLITEYIRKNVEEKIERQTQDLKKDLKLSLENAALRPANGPIREQADTKQDPPPATFQAVDVQKKGSEPKLLTVPSSSVTMITPPDNEPPPFGHVADNAAPKEPSADKQSRASTASDPTRAQAAGGQSGPNVMKSLEEAADKAAEQKETEKRQKLKTALVMSEKEEAAEAGIGVVSASWKHFKDSLTLQKKDTLLDTFMASIILANSVVIGISMDHDHVMISVLDVLFTILFMFEIGMKLYLHGLCDYLHHFSNLFDAFLVAMDVIQVILNLTSDDILSDAPAASMFRVVRLARLVRLVRLSRLQQFDDLVALISGMVGGITTLMWSVILFFIVLYTASLLFREFFGRVSYPFGGNSEDLTLYFNSVPRCMLTIFRAFFGDFTTMSGQSLFEGINEKYGAHAAVLVAAFFFMISIGLFNVIAAIFVESTLAAANHATVARKTERMNDELLWATRVSFLTRKLFEYNGQKFMAGDNLSEKLEELAPEPIPEDRFQQYMKDKLVIKALDDLEIDQADHKYLFDILDNDNTGEIIVSQLSDGLERLRGDPRRSDIICVDLMVRSIQMQTDFLVQAAKANVKSSSGNRVKMEENKKSLGRIEELLNRLNAQVMHSVQV